MLTKTEMASARDSLRSAESLIAAVRGLYLSAGYVQGARLMNNALALLADEIAALEKALQS